MYVAFEALCPDGHEAQWSASCPMSVTDTPIVSYNIRCTACTKAVTDALESHEANCSEVPQQRTHEPAKTAHGRVAAYWFRAVR